MSATESEVSALKRTIEDATTYPILTQGIDTAYASDRSANGAPAMGGSLNQVAQLTIRRLLGWRQRNGDAKGFTAALGKAFTLKDVEGHTEWEWKPQTFTLQADLGEITGAQASIHNQASLILEQAVKLLDGLTPLKPAADQEDVEAIRAIVRSEFLTLQEELGLKGGPRVKRVDLIFRQLVTDHPYPDNHPPDPFKIPGQVGELRSRFGLQEGRVNTIDEELNLTNFIILVDSTLALRRTWRDKRDLFKRDKSPYLGTQLVHLSQMLEVLVEDVHESYATMDSVMFGAAEREAEPIDLAPDPEMTVAELLGWVEAFAGSDGPDLLRSSGKDGATAFCDTSELLHGLVKQLMASPDLPDPLKTNRVLRALKSVERHLEDATKLARRIKRETGHHNGHSLGAAQPPSANRRWQEKLERMGNNGQMVGWTAEEGFDPTVIEKRDRGAATIGLHHKHDSIVAAALIRNDDIVNELRVPGRAGKVETLELELGRASTGVYDLAYIADGKGYVFPKAVVIIRKAD